MRLASTLGGRVKNLLPKRLFPRALLIIVLPILIVQIVLTWAFYERHWQSVSRHMMRGVVGDVEVTLTDLNAAKTKAEQDNIANRARRFFGLNVSYYPARDLLRQINPAEPDFDALTSTETLLARNINNMMSAPYDVRYSRPTRQFLIEVARDQGILRFAIADKRIITETTEIFLIWMVGTSLVVVIIAILFLRNQIRPIRALAEAAELFGKGREAKNFRPTGALEVRRAAIALIEMKNRLRRQIGDRTEMLAGVSHDLRAPLTRMKLQLAMLGEDDEVQALRADVVDMQRMIEEYLAFAKGQDMEAIQNVDLDALLAEIREDMRRQNLDLETMAQGDMMLPARRNGLKRCLTNLIDNAYAHGNRVQVTAERRAKQMLIQVDDNGPGIPTEQREAVFRAFRRLDSARGPDTGGAGLGLTIARDVVRGLGGDIRLDDAPLGGLRVEIRLPI